AVVDEWLVTGYRTGADCQCGGVADAMGVYHGALVAAVVSYAAVDGRAVAGCGVRRIAGDGGGGNREGGYAGCCRSGTCPRMTALAMVGGKKPALWAGSLAGQAPARRGACPGRVISAGCGVPAGVLRSCPGSPSECLRGRGRSP